MSEFTPENDGEQELRKRIKLENDYILDRVQDINKNIDISDHEVNKFLLIFHALMESSDSKDSNEETDGIITDRILQIVLKISSLLRQNIDLLNLPTILKNALKTIQKLFIKNNAANDAQTQSSSSTTETETKSSSSSSSSSSNSSNTSTTTTSETAIKEAS